jgi:hypothetical protein
MNITKPIRENGPYEGDKFVSYAGKVHEVKSRDRSAMTLTRYDIDPYHRMVSLVSSTLEVPTLIDVEEYLKERQDHMQEHERKKWELYDRKIAEAVAAGPGMEPVETDFSTELQKVLCEMESLLTKKNKDYGSSYDKTVEELGETVILVRIMDKFNRLKQLLKSGEPAEVEETIEETLSDLVGYGIIELVRRRRL